MNMIQFTHCFKWYLQRGSLLLMLLAFCASSFAQITGTVTDDKSGEAIIGASVSIKGTFTGTTTDATGKFSLDAKAGDVLEISYIGYTTKMVTIGVENSLLITLKEGLAFNEVVVTGYASQTRGDITGSVASVDMSEAIKAPVVNAAEALQGRVTGVSVVTSGQPGDAPKINIRGFGTSNNTNPLYIIDGVQTDDPNALNNISTDDIDQMNVLKDAAAAIYGARASNGVVIISTKGGGYNMDRPEITFSAFTGSSNISNTPGLLNTQQHAEMIWQSQLNDGLAPEHEQYGSGASPVIPSSILGYTRVISYPIAFAPAGQFNATVDGTGTNWIDAITQSAPVSSANFSIANGEKNGKYYLSAGYLKRDGILNHTGFERGNIKVNSEFKFANKFKVGEHLNLAFTNTRLGNNEAIEGASRMTPLLPVYDDDGEFTGVAGPGLSNTRNPVAQLYRTKDDYNKRLSLFGDVYLSYEIIEGLTAKTVLAGGFNAFNARYFTPLDPEHGEPISYQYIGRTKPNWL